MADGGDKEEIMRFLETAINQKHNKSWRFQVFPVPKILREDGIQVDEHIFQLADHGMPQVCCRHFKTL